MEDLTDLPLCESTRNNISLADRNAIIAAIRPAFARQRVQSEESAVAPYQYHFPDFDSVVHHEHPPVNKVQAGRIFMDAPLTMDVCHPIIKGWNAWLMWCIGISSEPSPAVRGSGSYDRVTRRYSYACGHTS